MSTRCVLGFAAVALLSACGKQSPKVAPAAPDAAPTALAAPADLDPPPADAQRSASGLAWKVLHPGTGTVRPEPQDLVEVHYTGWSRDGKMFDSSRPRAAPAQFELATAIKGWSEGIGLMVTGEQRRLWVPPALAYGDKPNGRAPAGPLVFDFELLKIIKKPRPPATPEDLAAPARNTPRTKSGLAYRVLRPGTGKQHPTRSSTVEIQYSGWTAEGRLFDSTVTRDQPAVIRLAAPDVIDGWKEALPRMVVGEKTRVWVPPGLGYGKRIVGGPTGMLVYDLELLAIK
jgi:peptidylprolyl isomerase